MATYDNVINVALNEVGYLEKASNSNLYDKTANAGSNNYTKYWADIYPSYQGEPWCACFVTWCLVQSFGKEVAAQMLGHYPYVYCPTGKEKAKAQGRWSSTPSVGSIIIFSNSSGSTASHTGIVYSYDNNYVYTVEGNTSGGSSVIANGGGVCKKSYSRSYSRIMGYWNIDYSLAEQEDTSETEVNYIGTITANDLNVRERPSTSASILAKHKIGDVVTICARTNNGWYRVEYPFGTGYIKSDYVSVTEQEEITQAEFNELMNNYLGTLGAYDPSDWSSDARNYVEEKGIIQGDEHGWKKYKLFLTREELAQILFQLHNKELI